MAVTLLRNRDMTPGLSVQDFGNCRLANFVYAGDTFCRKPCHCHGKDVGNIAFNDFAHAVFGPVRMGANTD